MYLCMSSMLAVALANHLRAVADTFFLLFIYIYAIFMDDDTMSYLYLFIQAAGRWARFTLCYIDVSVGFVVPCQCYEMVVICLIDSSLWLQYRCRFQKIL